VKTDNEIRGAGFMKRYRYEIDENVISKIKAERLRTGMGSRSIMRGMRSYTPKELSAEQIDRWLSGKTKKAYYENFTWVLERYSDLPSAKRGKF
jgi:hypothetical protein